jgi:hypothetical protein
MGRVCGAWRQVSKGPYEIACTNNGLPKVVGEGADNHVRNFVVLTAAGMSNYKATFTKHYGEPVGEDPVVTEGQMRELCELDPRNAGKRKYETHRGVPLFKAFKMTVPNGVIATLDENKRLTIKIQALGVDAKENKELEIPVSIVNIIRRLEYRKDDEGNKVIGDVSNDVYDQCTGCVGSPSIVFIGCKVPKKSRNKTWFVQENLFPIAGILELLISCGSDIREKNTCAYVLTGTGAFIQTRTSNFVVANGGYRNVGLMDFRPGDGLTVWHDRPDNARDILGTLPVIRAEDRPLVLGSDPVKE